MLNDRFLAIELLYHKSYELSEPVVTRIFPDGRKEYYLPVLSSYMHLSGNLDFIVKDKSGNIISDSRQERLTKNARYCELVEKYRSKDITLSAILSSYNLAVKDPDNELIHSYEIRDALCTLFHGEDKAINALGISE